MNERIIINETNSSSDAAHEVLVKTIAENNQVYLPIDVVRIADLLGMEVKRLPLEPGTDGILVKDEKYKPFKAVVDSNANPRRARFTLAHEIGHYVKDYQNFPDDKVAGIVQKRNEMSSAGVDPDEIWANGFAASLLMPPGIVKKLWAENVPYEDMAKMFGVSLASLGHRLDNLGYIE